MSTPDTLERAIVNVESNAHIEPIRDFYAEQGSSRVNYSRATCGERAIRIAGGTETIARHLDAGLVDPPGLAHCVGPR